MNEPQFIHLHIVGHLGCFQVLVIIYKAVICIHIKVLMKIEVFHFLG